MIFFISGEIMIKAVIFDLDHTLFDRYATLTEVAKTIRTKLPVDPNLSDEEIAEIMIRADKLCVYYGWDRIREYIVNETPLFTQKIDGNAYSDFVFSEFNNIAIPFPFTIPMLQALKADGFKLGLITNGKPGLQERKLEMLGLDNIFDRVIVSGQYNCPKPQLTAFKMMAERLELDPADMMYVGDNPLNDVDASRKAGYVPVYVNTVGAWPRPDIPQCELQVETVAEIPELVKRYNENMNR